MISVVGKVHHQDLENISEANTQILSAGIGGWSCYGKHLKIQYFSYDWPASYMFLLNLKKNTEGFGRKRALGTVYFTQN